MGHLSATALDAVEDAVRAVVAHDEARLSVLAPDAEDLYLWTRDCGAYGTVELVVPPGAVDEWAVDTIDGDKHVAVDMWTKEEGDSDLTRSDRLRSQP